MTKYAHLAQHLIILADNVEDLSEEILRLGNLLGFIRAKSTHHLMFNIDTLKNMIDRLNALYSREQIPQVSYREYFDLIKVGYYYSSKNVVLVFKFPVVRPVTYDLFKLSIVPNKENKILIPSYPFLAIHNKDFMFMEAECPKSSLGYLCEDKLNHRGSQADCIFKLITKQQIDETCHFTSITLATEAVEQLDDRHYVLSFPTPTKIRLSCSQDQYDIIKGSFLAMIPKGCLLQTTEFTISNNEDRIKGQIMNIKKLPAIDEIKLDPEERKIKFNSIDLQKLHASTVEMSMEAPIAIAKTDIKSVYHTIIPLYTLMLSAAALSTWIAIRKYLRKRTRQVTITDEKGNTHELDEVDSHQPRPGISAILSNLARQ